MTALIVVKTSIVQKKNAYIRGYQVDTNIQQAIDTLSDERKFCIDNMMNE